LRSHVLKAGLLIVLVSLCVVVPIVILLRRTSLPETENTENDETVSWTSPTTAELYSVFMVNADDGWAVGGWGTIQRWTGTEWIPEFPAATLMLILISLTLAAVILEKTTLKK
jgi:hypothetical protein